MHRKISICREKKAGARGQALTSGLDLKLKITFVLVQRSVGQTASSATYPPAALYNDNICACKTKARTHLVVKTHKTLEKQFYLTIN